MADAVSSANDGVHDAAHAEIFAPFDPAYFPSSIAWTLVCFGLMYLFFSRYFLPRLGAVMEERGERIRDDLDRAQAHQQEAQEARDAFEKAQHDAKAKAQATVAKAREKAEKAIAEQTQLLDDQLAAEQESASAKLKEIQQKLQADIDEIAAQSAQLIQRKLAS